MAGKCGSLLLIKIDVALDDIGRAHGIAVLYCISLVLIKSLGLKLCFCWVVTDGFYLHCMRVVEKIYKRCLIT